MTQLFDLVEYLNLFFDKQKHPFSTHFWLCKLNLCQFLVIVILYLALVIKFIPSIMRQRKPFNFQKTLFVYNLFLATANICFFYCGLKMSQNGKRFFYSNLPEYYYSNITNEVKHELDVLHFYFWSKLLDWCDTIFLCLRKKNVSFLHLYHHSIVPLLGYVAARINPLMPGIAFFMVCNSFVHSIMYFYYALATFGPSIQKNIWWKKYLTKLQLTQFIAYIIHSLIFLPNQIGYPKYWLFLILPQPPIFFWLFYKFYQNNYKKQTKPRRLEFLENLQKKM